MFIALGIRHQTARLELREQLAIAPECLGAALQSLTALSAVDEAVILTTCNRHELYIWGQDLEQVTEQLGQWLQQEQSFDWQRHRRSLFLYSQEDAIRHLLRVSSGLDSLILGEGQILGQVKDALRVAQEHQTSGFYLDRLFKTALLTGKRVRSETGLAQRDASVSQAAYELAQQLRPEMLQAPVAVIGGGKMASLILERLSQAIPMAQRHHQVTIVNRSPHRLDHLCQRYGFSGASWDELPEVLARAAVWFVATGAPHVVLHQAQVQAALTSNTAAETLIFDISVPRNVEPSVGELPKVRLLNTDDLAGQVSSLSQEAPILAHAEQVVELCYQEFSDWLRTLPFQKRLAQWRQQAEVLRLSELERLSPEKTFLDDPLEGKDVQGLMDQFSRSLLNKWLHGPSSQVRHWVMQSPDEHVRAGKWLDQLLSQPAHQEKAI